MNVFRNFGHAMGMVLRNIRSYLFLSMTVLLSFCFLLVYLIATDSETYNTYKDILARNPETSILQILNGDNMYEEIQEAQLSVRDYLSHIPNSHFSMIYRSPYNMNYMQSLYFNVIFIEDDAFGTATNPFDEVELLNIRLSDGQALANEAFYEWMQLSTGEEHPSLAFDYPFDDGTMERVSVTLVGGRRSNTAAPSVVNGSLTGGAVLYLPYSTMLHLLESGPIDCMNSFLIVYAPAEYQEAVYDYAKTSPYVQGYGSYNLMSINAAKLSIRSAIGQRSLMLCFFYVILAVNLYGSFRNALNDRKFEIGVKRAIGASKANIAAQFTAEGLIVIVGNLLLSVYLVLTGFLIYKTIRKAQGIVYTISLGWSALAGYIICCLALALLFSLIFAWQTSKVNVIDNLRAE